MAPFPEAEIMTIKRLEVALRKMDFKLLKDGAYKLHEKYHSGHKFEYLDLLKELYIEISNHEGIPGDVKDILIPTIEDILSQDGIQVDTATSPYETQNRVSNLTSLSYNTNSNSDDDAYVKEEIFDEPMQVESNIQESKEEIHHEEKLSAFDAFSAHKTQEPVHHFIQSPFSAEPFKEFNPPHYSQLNHDEPTVVEKIEHKMEETIQTPTENPTPTIVQENIIEPTETIKQDKKSVAIFYAQANSNDKINNIQHLRELLSNSKDHNVSINEILRLVSEIKIQANNSVSELEGILERLNVNQNKTSLITNCQSSEFFDVCNSKNIEYSLYKEEENKNLNIIGLYGLSNLFVCSQCGNIYLNTDKNLNPLVLECPKCKHPMYIDLYAPTEKAQINMEAYNSSLIALANSEVWLLIHPSYSDKTSSDMLESAFRVSSKVKKVYVLDKDINVREGYKHTLSQIREDVEIITTGNILEDFFNII